MNEAIEVLLVEDRPDDVELTLHAFKKHGIANRVHVARDGVEAIEFLLGSDNRPVPRLILLDLKLPRMDGREVLARIKADPRTRSIPVVVLTSSKLESDLVESYNLGVNSYIVKPVDFERFTEAVREIGLYWLLLNQAPAPEQL